MSEGARAPSTRLYNLLLCLSLGLTVGLLIIVAKLYVRPGWDTHIFCSAARAANSGLNPYRVRDLGLELSWNYQPYLLTAFQALCIPPIQLERSYPYLDAFLLMGSIAFLSSKSSFPLALVLSIGGFWGFGWTLITGNITVVEFMLVSITIALLEQRRWELAGLVLGMLASLKLFTIVYVGLLLFIPESTPRRLRVIASALFAFLLTFGLSYLLHPGLFQPFLEQIFGLIPNQHNVWMEAAKMDNVPLAFFLTDILALFRIRFFPPVSTIVGTVLVIAIVFWLVRKINLFELARESYLTFFCLGFLAFTMVMPRLKPYSFLMLVPPLYYLILSQGKTRQSLIIIVSAILPSILFLAQLFAGEASPLGELLVYSQTIFLLLTFAIIVHFIKYPNPVNHARTA